MCLVRSYKTKIRLTIPDKVSTQTLSKKKLQFPITCLIEKLQRLLLIGRTPLRIAKAGKRMDE